MTVATAGLRVLVVEDSADDARTVTRTLQAADAAVEVTVARRLDEVGPALDQQRFDAVLLDLTLPDSAGLETVVEVCGRAPTIAVVVVTGNRDAGLPAQSLRAGAEDYTVKSDLAPQPLMRTILHAIERHRRTVAALDHAKAEADGVTSVALGLGEEERERLRTMYADALDVAVDRAPYRGSGHRNLLGELAEELGARGATPRDVLDLHVQVMDDKYGQTHPDRRSAYLDEARVALIEVLGRLASYYRDRYLSSGTDEQRSAGRP
ncbi:MAG: response regulator [Frankiaceae bacterium]